VKRFTEKHPELKAYGKPTGARNTIQVVGTNIRETTPTPIAILVVVVVIVPTLVMQVVFTVLCISRGTRRLAWLLRQ
jgi:hypothetical protein